MSQRRKSIAQLQNEQVATGLRIQELNNWFQMYNTGRLSGNPKTLQKRAREYDGEIRKLQNKMQRVNMEYERTLREQVY